MLGLLNVLGEAQRCGVQRVLFASSGGALYGDVYEPADEDHPAGPISPYGITKWVGERYLQFYAHEFGLRCVALRYANVYGPRQNPHGEAGVVAVFATRMLTGEPSRVNGDGKYVRDYIHVHDVARANLAAFEADLPEPFAAFNVGTARGTDVNELAELVRGECQRALTAAGRTQSVAAPDHGPARAGDLRSSLVSPARAATILGWKPQVAIEVGLSGTIDWFAEHTLGR
jgi:UDP-glucose 4-epimerase